MTKSTSLPQHVAIIMDGNRRWARQHGLEIIKGHRKVADELLEELADHCITRGIPYLTLWAFSTENWHRDAAEVSMLMDLFREMLRRNTEKLHQKGVKLNVIGDISRFPVDIQQQIEQGLVQTKHNTKLTLTFALNYGGRDELTRAVRELATEVELGQLKPADITEETISEHLDTALLPDPDLIIRPGGELRLSGYLPWQSVYAELYFPEVLMPDFDPQQFDLALAEYARRQRRFGA